jgi:hypothetical protein
MIEYTATDENGHEWTVAITSDIERWWLNCRPTKLQAFCYDDKLQWNAKVVAWREGETTGHEAVDLRALHWEPPTDEELKRVREQRKEWLQQVASNHPML